MSDSIRKTGLNILAYAPLPEAALKSLLKAGVEFTLDADDNLSSALTLRCMNEDRRMFSHADLEALDARYPDAIKELVEHQLIRMDADGQAVAPGKEVTVDLYKASDLAQAQGLRDTSEESGFRSNDMQNNAATYNEGEIMRDAIRALGHVRVSRQGEHLELTDGFDFEGPFVSIRDNIQAAAAAANRGDDAESHNQVGSIFCRENERGGPTETSIPVKFSFALDSLSDEARQALRSMEERHHDDAAPSAITLISKGEPPGR